MPIEIRELVIKATVAPNDDGQQGAAAGTGSGNDVSGSEEIINACVERILEILKDKHER